MAKPFASCLFALVASAALIACSREEAPKAQVDHDPAMSAALQGQLLVDPDLSQQNMRNAAVVPGGPVDPATPPSDSP